MAKSLWGKVYYKETYAGLLREEPGGRFVFAYDEEYVERELPCISHSLPVRRMPFVSERGLHPFFDNLVAEGWLAKAQARALGVNDRNRFALLLGFGEDLAGAVSVVDPEPSEQKNIQYADEVTAAALSVRASLSGIQRKILLTKKDKQYQLVRPGELSTHIAKLNSGNLNELVELEYLSTLVVKKLLPDDYVVDVTIEKISDIATEALVVPRFDRTPTGKYSYHFEEFNQLLKHFAEDDKYNGSYEEMAVFMGQAPGCVKIEIIRLFKRVLACFLIGNTDAHFKNFAMFHTQDGLRLTPAYDLVASSFYDQYQPIALGVAGLMNLNIGDLGKKHIMALGRKFNLTDEEIILVVNEIEKQFPKSLDMIERSSVGSAAMRNKLTQKMEARWNGSFSLIGRR